MLKRLFVDNYRCLSNFELRPGEVTLLVGRNGTGKTCCWEVIAGLQDLLTRGESAERCFATGSLTRWDKRKEQRIELDVEIDGGVYRYALALSHDPERSTVRIGSESLTLDGAILYASEGGEVKLFGDVPSKDARATFPSDSRRSFLSVLEPRKDNRKTIAFRDFVSAIWLIAPAPSHMDGIGRTEADWLERNGSNLVSWLRSTFQESDMQAKLQRDLSDLFDGFQSLSLEKSGNVRELVLRFEASGVPYPLRLDELSDGQRVLLLLYSVLRGAVPSARVIVTDEPENFVALREIQPWLAELSSELRSHRGQALIISHHPEVIDYLGPDGALRLDRPAGGPTQLRPFVSDDSGLSLSQRLARGLDDE